MKLILHIYIILFFTLTIQSCATFPKSTASHEILTESNLEQINGRYKVRTEKNSLPDSTNTEYHNAFEMFYRGRGRGSSDTIKIDNLDNYTFELKLIENQHIEVTYLKNNTNFRKFVIEYFLKKDGYVYLKNKNYKISGIPYLFGSIDIKKLRLSCDENHLIIEEVNHSSGATLLIFGDSKTWNYKNKYERTE